MPQILISGAGIAGPVAAHFLALAGHKVTIIDRAPSILKQGQNLDIKFTALNVLNQMGILPALRAHSTGEKGACFVDASGRRLVSFPLEGTAFSPTNEYEILRGDLVEVLYNSTKSHPNITYRFGSIVKEVIENNADTLKVKIGPTEGGVDEDKEEEYDLLIAADGQWSSTRKMVFGKEDLTIIDKNCYFVYWTVPKTADDTDWWTIHNALYSRTLATRPDNHGTLRTFFTYMPHTSGESTAWMHASRSRDRQLQIDLVKSTFKNVGWHASRLLAGMDEADDLYFQSICQIKLAKWSKGRVVCIGDAAYAPTPFTGMGTALAIDGAYLLAGHLSTLKAGEDPKNAFDEYEAQFKPFVEKTQVLPFGMPRMGHPEGILANLIYLGLAWTLAMVARLGWVAKRYGSEGRREKLEAGLVEQCDAPYPTFKAFGKAVNGVDKKAAA